MRRMLLLPIMLLSAGLGLAACSSGSTTTYPTASTPAPAAVPAEPSYPAGPPVSSTGPAEESGAPVRAPTSTPQ